MKQVLSDKMALVTGANRGIGKQISLSLAAAGATVILSARNPETLMQVALQNINTGGNCESVGLDVTEEQLVGSVVDDWWSVHEVNARGAYLCSRAVMRYMTQQRSGRIIDKNLFNESP